MPTVALYDMNGQAIGEIALSEKVFAAPKNEALMHQAVVRYLANQRQGTAATKTRAMVRGGGRKPWRQKGTGRARHGSIRSPIWVGGGTVFGPVPRDYRHGLPKKARRQALRAALSAKVAADELIVVDQLTLPSPKTKEMAAVLGKLPVGDQKALIVLGAPDRNIQLSARNLPNVRTEGAANLHAYAVLTHGKVVLTKDAVARVEEVLG